MMAIVEFYYEGRNVEIPCYTNDNMQTIFQKFETKANINQNSVVFLYDGNNITNKQLTFNQLANNDDKYRNKMNILVSKSFDSSSSEFIFVKNKGADESMKDYAKMAILLAMKEHPDDDCQKSALVQNKFEEKYGGYWGCSFVKEGGTCFHYKVYFLAIKFGSYKITIAKTHE